MQKIKFDFEATKQLIYAPNSTAPIGAPVDADGNVANDGTAIGIVLCRRNESDKYWVKQNLVVMVAGYCDIIDAQEIWGDEYSAEAKSAMSDIIFCDDHKIGGGGGWPADLPKPSVGGYGYTEQGEQTVIVDNESVTTTIGDGGVSIGAFATPFDVVDGAYTVIFNGTEYNLNSSFNELVGYCLGEVGEAGLDFSRYPFIIFNMDEMAVLYTESAGDYEITVKTVTETVHTIDPKYLGGGGGGEVVTVTIDYDSGSATFDKTYEEILSISNPRFVSNFGVTFNASGVTEEEIDLYALGFNNVGSPQWQATMYVEAIIAYPDGNVLYSAGEYSLTSV